MFPLGSNFLPRFLSVIFSNQVIDLGILPRSEKTSNHLFMVSNFSCSLVYWAKSQTSHIPFQSQAGFQGFFLALLVEYPKTFYARLFTPKFGVNSLALLTQKYFFVHLPFLSKLNFFFSHFFTESSSKAQSYVHLIRLRTQCRFVEMAKENWSSASDIEMTGNTSLIYDSRKCPHPP